MASVDPYMPCPCGSGQKFKWCCQKVEAYAERSQRMVDSGQIEPALKPLDEGLARYPDNAWLLTRKALIEMELERTDAAQKTLAILLKSNPAHAGGTILMTRLLLEIEGPDPAIAQFQQGLSAMQADQRRELAPMAQYLGAWLVQAGLMIPGLKHLELAAGWAGREGSDPAIARTLQQARLDPRISPWQKNPYQLWPAPEGVTDAFRASFERAAGWAAEGLWASAASAFELLSAGSTAGAIADRNRGICCLWIADDEAAIASLRRYIAQSGPTTDAVDLEALCQILQGDRGAEKVEFVQLSWPVRDRAGLMRTLAANPQFAPGSPRPIDPRDQESTPADCFYLLDRPRIEARPGLTRLDIPLADAVILVGTDSVVLETHDDSRLDRLVDRFTRAAGATIPPAHPRTRVLEKVSRHSLTMSWQWMPPEGVSDEDLERLNREQRAHILGEVWPETPHPALRGRTPRQASKDRDAETALRAAFRLLETSDDADAIDWGQLRARLGVPPETPIDPADLDLKRLHLSRWSMIPVARLDDDRLVALYHSARGLGMAVVANMAGREIDGRAGLAARSDVDPLGLYGSLAVAAAQHGDAQAARDWLQRGRQAESIKPAPRNLEWELIELQVDMVVERLEEWVPKIVVLLERYRGNPDATRALLYRLTQVGLVRAVADEKRPGHVLLDTSPLEHLIATYGPRVTTASGELGVAASRGEIWTPDSARGGQSIWTPGSGPATAPAAASGQPRPRLILPGQ